MGHDGSLPFGCGSVRGLRTSSGPAGRLQKAIPQTSGAPRVPYRWGGRSRGTTEALGDGSSVAEAGVGLPDFAGATAGEVREKVAGDVPGVFPPAGCTLIVVPNARDTAW
ncbi:hypothetical protein [Streptomyces bullii]